MIWLRVLSGTNADLMIKGGPKTFIAQSYFDTGGESWWLLQPAVKQGATKNLFLKLKDLESRFPSLHLPSGLGFNTLT